MGCCCCKGLADACEPCCRRIGCSCKERDSEYRADIEKKNRTCTDLLVVLLFLGFIGYMCGYVWSDAYANGNPNRLTRGVDWASRICGDTELVKDKPFAYWPDPINYPKFKVCTDDCADTQQLYKQSLIPYISQDYLGKYCLPSSDGAVASNTTNTSASQDNVNAISSLFNGNTEKLERQIGDINTAMPIIGISIVISFFAAFLFIGLMKVCVALLVWSTIILIFCVGAYFGFVFWGKASEITDAGGDAADAETNQYIAYAIWGVCFIYFVIILFARKRIKIAVEVIKSASRSLKDMPLMVLFPIWPLLFVVGFFMAWVYGAVYIYSNGGTNTAESGDLKDKDFGYGDPVGAQFEYLNYDETTTGPFAPHFFLLLWINQTCVYLTFTIIAGAVADWYFTRRDEKGNKIRGIGEGELTPSPVFSSCKRTMRYHMGTILYAAGIIAIIQFIRYAIRYMERMANGGKKQNALQKLISRMVDCLLWCLECCLDKISRNALIFTAIYGDPFCPAICGSFKLVWANLMRVAVITFFSTIVTGLGKILIPLTTVGVCGAILLYVEPYKSSLESIIWPLFVIALISLAIGLLFLTVYDTAIDTVFMCFLIDEKANKDRGMMLADEGLRNIVQKYEAESKQLADSMQNHNSANAQGSKVGTAEIASI